MVKSQFKKSDEIRVRFFKYFDRKEVSDENVTIFSETAVKFHIKNIRVILKSEQLFFVFFLFLRKQNMFLSHVEISL